MLVAVMAIAAAACGDGGSQPTAIDLGGAAVDPPATDPPATDPPASELPSTELPSTEPSGTEPSATTQQASTAAPRQRPDGPAASDFELALGGPGGTFSLSDETRPVFMVFWAEW